MGFLTDIGAGALIPVTGGASWLIRNKMNPNQGPAYSPAQRTPWTAKDITVDPSLDAAFGNVGTNAQNAIGKNYTNLASRQATEGAVRGQAPGSNSYGTQRLGTQQGLDIGGLRSALGGEIGNTAYENMKQTRDYGQNAQLAQETAALNKPDILSQIFSSVGAVGKPVATYAGMGGFKSRRAAYDPYANNWAEPAATMDGSTYY